MLCPEREHLLSNFRNSGFPLKFWSREYLFCTILIPYAISCSIILASSTVRLSILVVVLFIEDERVRFLIFC